MAALTLTDILARFRVVLEAEPLNLKAANDAFSHARQPAGVLTDSYYLEDGGIASNRSVGNYDTVRLHRVVIYVARHLGMDSEAALASIATTLTAIERALIGDGTNQSYQIAPEVQQRITRPANADYAVGSLTLSADFDYDES